MITVVTVGNPGNGAGELYIATSGQPAGTLQINGVIVGDPFTVRDIVIGAFDN
jgi:hypothetical protein